MIYQPQWPPSKIRFLGGCRILPARCWVRKLAVSGQPAALPPHSAERLRLSGQGINKFGGCASNYARHSLAENRHSLSGRAKPFRTVRRQSRGHFIFQL